MCLTGEEKGKQGEAMVRCSSSSHRLAPEEAEEGGVAVPAGPASSVSTGEPTGHTRRTQRAVLLRILARQSDVHLKLRIVPNCMLPVVIVQVVQIVYFYFGVFD